MTSALLDAMDQLHAIRVRAAVLEMAIFTLPSNDDRDLIADFAGQVVNDLIALNQTIEAIKETARNGR